jgi:hypothetical protein
VTFRLAVSVAASVTPFGDDDNDDDNDNDDDDDDSLNKKYSTEVSL